MNKEHEAKQQPLVLSALNCKFKEHMRVQEELQRGEAHFARTALYVGLAEQALGSFLELVEDVSVYLRAMVGTQRGWL